ncbi:hypothetical protein OAL66_01875 [bacterium]|nr:hypothetical protein [bacterium]
MNRSRSFNRFHRYLARQKRHELKAVLPQSNQLGDMVNMGVDQRRNTFDRLSHQDVLTELLESQA